ncbi:MAG: hypothetical protein NTX03_12435 [Bacteroidetes bacterium]|nr:hypothetical protein [Bacteroidota bacterium]
MNTKLVGRFVLHFILFILLILVVAGYPVYKFFGWDTVKVLVHSFLVFFFITLGAFILSTYKTKQAKDSLRYYLASIGIKMLIALIYFLAMLKSYAGFEWQFTLSFLSAYFLCTGFELYYLLSNLRQNSDAPNDAEN